VLVYYIKSYKWLEIRTDYIVYCALVQNGAYRVKIFEASKIIAPTTHFQKIAIKQSQLNDS
jgi:hypothetical protein